MPTAVTAAKARNATYSSRCRECNKQTCLQVEKNVANSFSIYKRYVDGSLIVMFTTLQLTHYTIILINIFHVSNSNQVMLEVYCAFALLVLRIEGIVYPKHCLET